LTGARPGTCCLAFDFGSKSIGVAAATADHGLATPLRAVRVFRAGPDWAAIDGLVAEWGPDALVVGLPLDTEGGHTPMSLRARKFGRRLAQRYNLQVNWIDETLSTSAARGALRAGTGGRRPGKGELDNTAAALILESFLSTR